MDGSAPAFLDDLSFVASSRQPVSGGILYIEDFDAEPEGPPVVAGPAEPPLFTEDDIRAAREAGHAHGMQAALNDAGLVQAQLQVAATQALADALTGARATLDRVASERAAVTAGLVLSVLQAALPTVMARHGACEAEAMLLALLPGLRCEPELRVRAHPDLADAIRDSLVALLPQEGGVLSVTADPVLAPGDVQVSWQDGQAARNCADIWQSVRTALESLALPSLEDICRGC